LRGVWQLLVHDSLADPVEQNPDQTANCDHKGDVETKHRELHGVAEERPDHVVVVENKHQILLLLNDTLLLHLLAVLFPVSPLRLGGGLLEMLCLVLRLDLILGVSGVEYTRSVS